jgi:hypothetical protein
MIPLRELRLPGVALDWHEAVALVAALAAAVREVQLPRSPAFEAIGLALDGDVGIVNDAMHEGAPVQGVAAVLERLLESRPCPVELVQLAQRYRATDPAEAPDAALDRFLRDLSFFERPGRDDMLRELAKRAVLVVEQSRASDALERLRERARQQPDEPRSPASRAVEVAESTVQLARRLALPSAIVALVALLVAFLAATFLTTAKAPERPESAAAQPVDNEVAPEPVAPAPSVPTPAGPPPAVRVGPTTRDASAPTPRGRDRVLPVERQRPDPSSAPARTAAGVDVRVNELSGAALPANTASAPEVRPGVIYASGDQGVQPAILLRPHLPAEPAPGVAPESIGTLELIVSESGAVEHVRLISPSNRFQDRMLVAAAKAWLFKPAVRDGRPVRFRMRIRVTL